MKFDVFIVQFETKPLEESAAKHVSAEKNLAKVFKILTKNFS
jgi:hypothetical protein